MDPLQVLDSVKDAHVAVQVPLKAGEYKLQGHTVRVPANTTMTVQMEVHDGRLVPARGGRGQPEGSGTRVDINPPLDLPAWATARGAYVEDKGKGQGQVKADIGGWFDQNIGKKTDLQLGNVVRSFADGSAARPPSAKEKTPFPAQMFDFDSMRFTAGEVTLKDRALDLGSMKVDLADGNRLTIDGTGRSATAHGLVKLDSVGVNQDGFSLKSGPTTASVEATYARQPDGTLTVSGRVSGLDATLEGLESTRARAPGDTDPDRVSLGASTLRNGQLSAEVRVGQRGGRTMAEATSLRASGEVTGTVNELKLGVKDGRDDARLSVTGGRLQGSFAVGPDGTRVDATVRGTRLEVADLQSEGRQTALDLHHARVQGDARVKVDTAARSVEVEASGRQLDVRVDDLRYRGQMFDADLARTELTGDGTLKVSNSGVAIRGDLRIKGGLDDFRGQRADGDVGIDVARGSTLDAHLTELRAGADGFALDAKGTVDVGLEKYRAAIPGVTAEGDARLSGTGALSIRNDRVSFTSEDARLRMNVDDAKVAPGGDAFSLDVAQGSSLDLRVNAFTASRDAAATQLQLRKGSVLDATLDGGHVQAGGTRMDLQPGSRARFEIDRMEQKPGAAPAVQGRLSVDVTATGQVATGRELAPGVRLDAMDGAAGTARLTVDDVTLREDGTFSLKGVAVGVHARAGSIRGVAAPLAAPGTPMAAPAAPVEVQGPRLAPEVSPTGTLSAGTVQASSAGTIAGADTRVARAAQLQPLEMAKRIQDGTLHLEIPVEGRVGGSVLGVDFLPGTTLTLDAKVVNGRVIPDQTKATLSKPGDATAWVGVRGAYFDKNNTLRADLSGFPDLSLSDKLKNMPMDVSQFVDRLSAKGERKSGNTGSAPDILKLDRATFSVRDASFAPGPMAVPGGFVDVAPGNRMSVSGTPQAATLRGNVNLRAVDVVQDGVALKTGPGSAELAVQWNGDASGNGRVTTELRNMSLQTQYAVEKRANGDYLHLAEGRVEGGSLRLVADVKRGASGAPALTAGETVLDLPRFDGTLAGGRVTVKDADGTAQVELGRTRVSGSVHADRAEIRITGEVQEMDAAVRDFAAAGGRSSARVDYARVQGSGRVDFSTKTGVSIDADVHHVQLRAPDLKAGTGTGTIDAGTTVVAGSGKVSFRSNGDLSVKGDLRMQTTLDAARLAAGTAGNQVDAKVDAGSTVTARVNSLTLSRADGLRIAGEAGVDLTVADFATDAGGARVTGRARVRGGGAFTVDPARGLDLPKAVRVDVDVTDAKLGIPGSGLFLDVAKGTRLTLQPSEADLGPDGTLRRVDLGKGSRMTGTLDGGEFRLPGTDGPIVLGAGTGFDFVADEAVLENGARVVQGHLTLQAEVDASSVDLAALTRRGAVTIAKVEGARAHLNVNVGTVRLGADGSVELRDTSAELDAKLADISGEYWKK
ncbi:MAG: hypothetical protein HY904_15705 [Deltaproteobacteria bacterium]|nr:hypothetical protein [Deltaproteobacteria bacterium]